MSRLRFGVIGCGVIGGLHARVLSGYAPLAERARLVAVASPSPQRARRLAEETGSEATDVAALLDRSDIDVISVCTPSGLHAELGLRALAAGKHVVVEKPVEVTAEAADRLIAGARQAGRALAVISQRRFDPASRMLRSALDAGEFGTLTSGLVEVPLWRGQSYYDSGDWRGSRALDGGGALLNQGVHAVDLVQWLMGPVVEVAAHTALKGHHGIEVEDVVTASLRHAGGALTSLLATTAAYPGRTTRLTVHGDRGSAVIDNDELTWFHAAGPEDDTSAYGAYGAGNQAAERRPAPVAEQRDASGLLPSPHGDQLLDFCDAVTEGRPPAVDGEEGRRALRTVLAVYEAARTGAVVQVAPAPETSPAPSAPMTPEPA
ncbi:Gfo/Idh/MocA family protein [Streptomyces collinus]|uniref:Oxidoreductase domain-containing protein n=1 Tax=Streptomyces collinus (strain DSM 40733 / Tue 365) TaxID=1214242 RepID=S5UVY2_STRC3|nr:Gfo/Idh/MocA family oxidoreductase [Streptomyces collinus]AGS67219.1 oxidoreductase domain-containing protein [Streptomyces collinus Tu 365]AGS73475.1 oxidoreductase domain-containing protein [Streptomyces collinus Tu 365]